MRCPGGKREPSVPAVPEAVRGGRCVLVKKRRSKKSKYLIFALGMQILNSRLFFSFVRFLNTHLGSAKSKSKNQELLMYAN